MLYNSLSQSNVRPFCQSQEESTLNILIVAVDANIVFVADYQMF